MSTTTETKIERTKEEVRWSSYLDLVVDRLRPLAAKANASDAYYLNSKQEMRCVRHAGKTSYPCGQSEEDFQRFCEKCGRILDHCWSDHGVAEEIGLSGDCKVGVPVDPNEAFTLLRIIDCGVPRLTERCGQFVYNSDMKPAVEKIARRLGLPKYKAAGRLLDGVEHNGMPEVMG